MAENENMEAAGAQIKKLVNEDDQTAKIPRPNQPGNNGKVVLKSNADSTIRPSAATRIAPAIPQSGADNKQPVASAPKPKSAKTIKLKPVSEAVAEEDQDVGETISVDRNEIGASAAPQVSAKPDAAPIPKPAKSKTIKLKPLKPNASPADDNELGETLSFDRDSLSDVSSDALKSNASGGDDEATIKIQKPSTNKPAHPVPAMPGGKETIKLRPSNNTPPPPSAPTVKLAQDDAQAEGKRTIKLVPKKSDDDATQKTPRPSDPTVKLQEVAETPAAPPPSPSAPTMKMPADGEDAGATKPSAKRTLKLKSTAAPAPAAPPAPGGDAGASTDGPPSAGDAMDMENTELDAGASNADAEPNVVFTLVAVSTLGLLAYFAYLAGTQLMALNG